MAESQNIEYKESWRDEFLKWICGFANAQGGKIFIGCDNDGNVVGVKGAKKLMEDIPNKIRDGMGIIVPVNLLEKERIARIDIVGESKKQEANLYEPYNSNSSFAPAGFNPAWGGLPD